MAELFLTIIQQKSTLHLVLRLRGGGFSTITFNNLQNPIILQFSQAAPAWRGVCYGLILEGTCVNPRCDAFNQKVWINKNFGKFNIGTEVYKSNCPQCNQLCEDVENMGIYQAICICEGRIKGDKDQMQKRFQQVKKDQFLTFEDKKQTRVDWLYLEMELLPLHEK